MNRINTKTPNALQRWLNRWREFFYYLFRGKFFIVRHTVETVGTHAILKNRRFFHLNEQYFKADTPTRYCGLIWGGIYVWLLRRRYKETSYRFSLMTIQDVHFINHVTGGK